MDQMGMGTVPTVPTVCFCVWVLEFFAINPDDLPVQQPRMVTGRDVGSDVQHVQKDHQSNRDKTDVWCESCKLLYVNIYIYTYYNI